ncbi:MAG: hypothetical protein JSV84_14645 [Gemmatimonadota bacterium]|nr:MAG: hypothetical protein JSV84_14645 [Gemmatimonadota bacterium]
MGIVKRILGYLILLILSFVPAGIAYYYGGVPTLIGKFYLGTIVWVAIAWGALTLIRKGEEEI